MRGFRIVAASVAFLASLGLAIGGAAAQTATAGSPGQPLPLLLLARQKNKTIVRPHPKPVARFARRRLGHRRIARHAPAKGHDAVVSARRTPTAPATALPPANIWPAASVATPDGLAAAGDMATSAPRPAPVSVKTEAVVDTDPNQIVADGRNVQAASVQAATTQTASAHKITSVQPAAHDHQGATERTPANPVATQPVVRAMVVKAAPQDGSSPNPIGSDTWLAHLLAALGGAIAAGAVAWFLINPAPRRTYG